MRLQSYLAAITNGLCYNYRFYSNVKPEPLFLQVLNDFLLEINRKSVGTNFKAMIVVLLGHSKSSNSSTQLIALIWILR